MSEETISRSSSSIHSDEVKKDDGHVKSAELDAECCGIRLYCDRKPFFEKLPLDAILEIFRLMPANDVVKLRMGSSLLNSAVRIHLKNSMISLRRDCIQNLPMFQNRLINLPMSQDDLRLSLVKAITISRYFSTEIEVLFAIVWRLRDDKQAWTEVAPDLAPVIDEFDHAVRNLDSRRYELNDYGMKQMLSRWYQFLDQIDSGLGDRLYSMAKRKTPYEIHVIDMLMCAPSFSFQLALKRLVTGGAYYDIYGFFKTVNLKPFCQVPDVFNAELDIIQKKRTLIAYLRETVQKENMSFLGDMSTRILDHELTLQLADEHVRSRVVNQLHDCYRNLQESPYAEVMKRSKYSLPKELYEEYYVRCPHENMSYTGLHCIVVAPQQDVWNLPIAVPFLRGRTQRLIDHFDTVDMEGTADLSNLFPPFAHQEDMSSCSSNRAEVRVSEAKPKLQLIVHYRESCFAAPSEIVVNIGYDDDGTCHLTFHNLHGELLHPPLPGPAAPPALNNLQ